MAAQDPGIVAALLPLAGGEADVTEYLCGVIDEWLAEQPTAAAVTPAALAETLAGFVEADSAVVASAAAALVPRLAALHVGTAVVPDEPQRLATPVSGLVVPVTPVQAATTVIAPPEPSTAASTAASAEDVDEITAEQHWADALDDTDAYATAWAECLAAGRPWGGKGHGGRGVARRYAGGSTGVRDVCVDNVTLAYAGKELLQGTTLRLARGRRYALLGRNGAGKSTLLRRIAAGRLPGFPPHLRVVYVPQELPLVATRARLADGSAPRALDYLVHGACARQRHALEAERAELERALLVAGVRLALAAAAMTHCGPTRWRRCCWTRASCRRSVRAWGGCSFLVGIHVDGAEAARVRAEAQRAQERAAQRIERKRLRAEDGAVTAGAAAAYAPPSGAPGPAPLVKAIKLTLSLRKCEKLVFISYKNEVLVE